MISDLLDMMRVRSTAYVGKNLTAPWGILVSEHPTFARFHLVMAGNTWMRLDDGSEPRKLEQGDIVIIPHGAAHIYSDTKFGPVRGSGDLPNYQVGPYFHRLGEDPDATNILCGFFEISTRTPPAILQRLPSMLVANVGASQSEDAQSPLVELLRIELSKDQEPSNVVLNRLTELICLYAIEHWLDESLNHDERLTALAEPKIKLVLDHIHDDPAEPWTVERLAKLYGQSRNAFAGQFKHATGLAPMSYVRRWRIQAACRMLADPGLTIDEIAFKSGYADTNAFSRAFKREIGDSPGAYKRGLRSQPRIA